MKYDDVLAQFTNDLRYSPPLFGLFIFGLLLLLFRDLTDPIRRYLVPSVAIYVLGASIITYIHTTLSCCDKLEAVAEKKEFVGLNKFTLRIIFTAHALWFMLFIAYCVWRDIL